MFCFTFEESPISIEASAASYVGMELDGVGSKLDNHGKTFFLTAWVWVSSNSTVTKERKLFYLHNPREVYSVRRDQSFPKTICSKQSVQTKTRNSENILSFHCKHTVLFSRKKAKQISKREYVFLTCGKVSIAIDVHL